MELGNAPLLNRFAVVHGATPYVKAQLADPTVS